MSAVKAEQQYISIEEYLAFEEKSEVKHEYEDGQIFAINGGFQTIDRRMDINV